MYGRCYALALRLLLVAACLTVAAAIAIGLYQYPQFLLAAVAIRAWARYRRMPSGSRWSHGFAKLANLATMIRGGLLSPRGFILGKLIPDAPTRRQAIGGLLSQRLDSSLAVRQFLAAWFGSHWLKDVVVRVANRVHVAVFAPSGAGKDVSIVIPNMLGCPDNMVAVDVKGELHETTSAHRSQRFCHRIITLAPLGVNGKPVDSDTLNPLDFIERNESFIDDCRELAHQLVTRTGRESDEHWVDSAVTVLKAMIGFVCAEEKAEWHLGTVRLLVSSLHAFDKAVSIMQQSADPIVRQLGAQLTVYQDKEKASVLSTVQRYTEFLDGPAIAGNVARSSFHPNILKTGKATVYLCLPPSKLASLAPLQRMWIGTIMRVTTSGAMNEQRPVTWILDEFAHIGRIQAVEDAVTLLRGAGVRLVFCFQAHSQMKDCFGDKAFTVMDNLATQIYFGLNSLETAKTLSEMLGDTTIPTGSYNRSTSQSRPVGGSGPKGEQPGNVSRSESYSQSDMARRVLKPEEILTLDERIAIVRHRNLSAAFVHLIRYYEAPEFRRRWFTGSFGTGKQRGLGLQAGAAVCTLLAASLLFIVLSVSLPERDTVRRALLQSAATMSPDRRLTQGNATYPPYDAVSPPFERYPMQPVRRRATQRGMPGESGFLIQIR